MNGRKDNYDKKCNKTFYYYNKAQTLGNTALCKGGNSVAGA